MVKKLDTRKGYISDKPRDKFKDSIDVSQHALDVHLDKKGKTGISSDYPMAICSEEDRKFVEEMHTDALRVRNMMYKLFSSYDEGYNAIKDVMKDGEVSEEEFSVIKEEDYNDYMDYRYCENKVKSIMEMFKSKSDIIVVMARNKADNWLLGGVLTSSSGQDIGIDEESGKEKVMLQKIGDALKKNKEVKE